MDRRSEVVLVQDGTRVIWTVPHRRVAGLALGRVAARGSLSLAMHAKLSRFYLNLFFFKFCLLNEESSSICMFVSVVFI